MGSIADRRRNPPSRCDGEVGDERTPTRALFNPWTLLVWDSPPAGLAILATNRLGKLSAGLQFRFWVEVVDPGLTVRTSPKRNVGIQLHSAGPTEVESTWTRKRTRRSNSQFHSTFNNNAHLMVQRFLSVSGVEDRSTRGSEPPAKPSCDGKDRLLMHN